MAQTTSYGLAAGADVLRQILMQRKLAEIQAQKDANARAQLEFENSIKARAAAVPEGRLSLDTHIFEAGAPQRDASVGKTLADTAATSLETRMKGSDYDERNKLLGELPDVSVGGRPSLRMSGRAKVLAGIDLLNPSAERASVSAADLGRQAGESALAEFEGGGRAVTQGKEDINTAAQAKLIGMRAASGEDKGLSANQEALAISRLQKDWDAATANYKALRNQSRNMDIGMDAAKRGDLAAGAQAVLVTFQKILDPTSVVRESEYARSASGQSLISQIEGWAQRLEKGGAGVPVAELQKFANVAKEFVKASESGLSGRRARLEQTAKRFKIDPSLIFDSPVGSAESATKSDETAPARKWNPVTGRVE